MNDIVPNLRPQDRIVKEQLKVYAEKIKALDADMATDEDLFFATLDGQTDIPDQLRHIVRISQYAEAEAMAIRNLEVDLAARRKRKEQKAEVSLRQVAEAMAALGIKTLPAPDFTASLRDGKPELLIRDAELPPSYRHLGPPDRPMIRKALEAGEEVLGASLGNASPVLTVRTK